MDHKYEQKHFALNEEKLERLKAAVDASPQEFLLIVFCISSQRGGLPVFWDVVYRQDKGWIVDIMDSSFQLSYRQHAPCQMLIVITDDNKLVFYPMGQEMKQ